MDYLIIVLLISFSGLFSGLTLGLFSLNKSDLENKIKTGNKDAKKVYAVRKNGNLLLCTLLLGNVMVNSTLSIFLGGITSGIIAGITATGLIVIFGEIVPQAACSRYALQVGARTAWLVKIFIFTLWPICRPLSWVLDKFLGSELQTIWSRTELKEIIKTHEDSSRSKIDADEEKILLGALSFSDKTVIDVLTPRSVVFALEVDSILNIQTLKKIKKSGFTRIPVYEEHIDNMVGILYAKDLIGVKTNTKIKTIHKDTFLVVTEDEKLDNLFNKFKRKRLHLAFVYDEFNSFSGIITLEDIIEEIIGSEIVDETDVVVDLRKQATDNSACMLNRNKKSHS